MVRGNSTLIATACRSLEPLVASLLISAPCSSTILTDTCYSGLSAVLGSTVERPTVDYLPQLAGPIPNYTGRQDFISNAVYRPSNATGNIAHRISAIQPLVLVRLYSPCKSICLGELGRTQDHIRDSQVPRRSSHET